MKLRESRQETLAQVLSVSVFLFSPPKQNFTQQTILTDTYGFFESNKSSLLILYELIYIRIHTHSLNSYDLKWYFARRQTVPIAELHGVQSDRLLDSNIMRGGIRRWTAAKIRRDRRQATVGIVEPVLGVGASKTGNCRPLRGKHEGIQRSGYYGRGSVKRSGQVHRCVSTSMRERCWMRERAIQRRDSRRSSRFRERTPFSFSLSLSHQPILCIGIRRLFNSLSPQISFLVNFRPSRNFEFCFFFF